MRKDSKNTGARWGEAKVQIGQAQLTYGQAMTLRVAVQQFALTLTHEGLGDDEGGKALTAGYLRNLNELNQMLKMCRSTQIRKWSRHAETTRA